MIASSTMIATAVMVEAVSSSSQTSPVTKIEESSHFATQAINANGS
jgi:hypothetical protein